MRWSLKFVLLFLLAYFCFNSRVLSTNIRRRASAASILSKSSLSSSSWSRHRWNACTAVCSRTWAMNFERTRLAWRIGCNFSSASLKMVSVTARTGTDGHRCLGYATWSGMRLGWLSSVWSISLQNGQPVFLRTGPQEVPQLSPFLVRPFAK